jgi:hypothetical protein
MNKIRRLQPRGGLVKLQKIPNPYVKGYVCRRACQAQPETLSEFSQIFPRYVTNPAFSLFLPRNSPFFPPNPNPFSALFMMDSAANARLAPLGISRAAQVHLNLSPEQLTQEALRRQEGVLTDTGALMADTGTFTGRSPKDRFIVKDAGTAESVWWGDINIPFDEAKFDQLHQKMVQYLADKEIFVRDAYAGANPDYQLKLRVVNELAWHNLFCYNMFLRPAAGADTSWTPDFSIICAPGFEADPAVDGTRQPNFAILNFTKKMILIGGTATRRNEKRHFGVLNYLLPHEMSTLPMHCSANVGQDGDTAIFFGLSAPAKPPSRPTPTAASSATTSTAGRRRRASSTSKAAATPRLST